jgi:GDPmannose 4,6-dehydratase
MPAPDYGILIIGSEGQDGQVLQQILSREGASVYRQTRNKLISPIGKDLGEPTQELLQLLFKKYPIKEIYFLAATHTPAKLEINGESKKQMEKNFNLIQDTLVAVLEVIREISPDTRIFFASSALVFGEPESVPQTENTPNSPIEIYGLFKQIAQEIITYYRESLGIFSISGILYPHESEFRKEQFLFKKIIEGARIALEDSKFRLEIVDLDFTREWNCAYQVMESARDVLRLDEPQDFLIGSGKQESVEKICQYSFEALGLDFSDFVIPSKAQLIKRSNNLLSNPDKLFKATGRRPDGDVKGLVERTTNRMQGYKTI